MGKTYRMLEEGRQALEQGVDVVIGYLEPHDRPDTIALAEGLEVVPRRKIEHGGVTLEEMDVEAVVRRVPELALIDELAHTNAPGSENQKRYEDIEEVLDAGIDVISTVNIQHLESLNDLVFEVTGVRVRETVPDRVLDEADEVAAGRPHSRGSARADPGGQGLSRGRIESALQNFFKADNLSSLRQLALREVAEDVEARRSVVSADDPMARRAIGDRILVLVEPGRPASACCAVHGVPGSGWEPTSTRSGCIPPAIPCPIATARRWPPSAAWR